MRTQLSTACPRSAGHAVDAVKINPGEVQLVVLQVLRSSTYRGNESLEEDTNMFFGPCLLSVEVNCEYRAIALHMCTIINNIIVSY